MTPISNAARRFLYRIEFFSRYVLRMPLYRYQQIPLRAILDSVLHQKGYEFFLIFPRQSGKNEAIAHLLVYLLNVFHRTGGNIVFAAIGDGVGRDVRRLEERLENPLNQGCWHKGTRPLRRTLGRVAVIFLSSHPAAHARGERVHWLLVVDELQNNDAAHIEAVLEPMPAANNGTAVYLDTVRFAADTLEQKRRMLEGKIARLGRDLPRRAAPGPTYRAVDVFVDHGWRHFQDVAGRPSLVRRLLAFLQRWNAVRLVGDSTGVGEGVCDWLAAALGPQRLTPVQFTLQSKARLGTRFLSVVETGRFHYWRGDEERPLSDGWWFWQQCAHCTYEVPPGGTLQHHMQWGVPASATVSTPSGRQAVHDDRLMSAALVSLYDDLVRQGAVATGQARSAVIRSRDPLDDMTF